MYHRVYAPDGEPFDVTREKADSLILQEGWTQNPPKVVSDEVAREEKVPSPRRGRNATKRRSES